MQTSSRKAFSYVRFSHPSQAEGDSLRRQFERAQAHCDRKGWILENLKPDKGVSAFRGKNAAVGYLAEFLRMIETGRVKPGDALIVENVDRISRQGIDEGYDLIKKILKAGIILVTLSPEREYDASAVTRLTKGALELQIILERAAEESEAKSYRVSESWKKLRDEAAQGKGKAHHNCPCWLKLNEDKTEWIKIHEAIVVIQHIYRLARSGLGVARITRHLNLERIPPITAGLTKEGKKIRRWTGKFLKPGPTDMSVHCL
jgi:DNA invertase Pin-like site-specific DNA recombinase